MRHLLFAAATLTHPAFAAPVPPPAVAEAELRAINHRYVEAWIQGDARFLADLVDADFRLLAADGRWLDRAAYLATAGEPARVRAVSYEDVRVRLYDAVALVHGSVGYLDGADAPARLRYTDVYRWDGAAWRLVAAQLSPVRDPARAGLSAGTRPTLAAWQGEAPRGDDTAVLADHNRNYVRAFLEGDAAWYDAHLAPDYLVAYPDGSLHDKAGLLADSQAPASHIVAFPIEQFTIRRFGDVALLSAHNPYLRRDGQRGENRYTDIWVKQDGRWLCVAAHITPHILPH